MSEERLKEIKEILDNVRKCCDITKDQNFVIYQRQDILKLLDYITNLQQENERLKELDENYPIEEELAEAYKREEDYKARCEKAIKFIDIYINTATCLNTDYDINMLVVKDILRGDDK